MEHLGGDTTTIRIANIANRFRERNASAVSARSRVLLNISGSRVMRGHALEVSVHRLMVSIPSTVSVGDECAAFIAVTIDDETIAIVGSGEVINCKCCGTDGYRAELRFTPEGDKSRLAIEQLFNPGNAPLTQ